MDRNSTLQASFKAHGPIFCNQSIELNKLNNFCSICVKKIFISKKLWIKMFEKFCRNFFVDFRVQASFGAFWATPMKILKRTYLYVVYIPRKFQSCILNRFCYKFRTTRPSKFDKIDDISRPEVTSSKQKNVY